MKLTRGKIAKIHRKKRQSARRRKHLNKRKSRQRSLRQRRGLDLSRKTLKRYYGGAEGDDLLGLAALYENGEPATVEKQPPVVGEVVQPGASLTGMEAALEPATGEKQPSVVGEVVQPNRMEAALEENQPEAGEGQPSREEVPPVEEEPQVKEETDLLGYMSMFQNAEADPPEEEEQVKEETQQKPSAGVNVPYARTGLQGETYEGLYGTYPYGAYDPNQERQFSRSSSGFPYGEEEGEDFSSTFGERGESEQGDNYEKFSTEELIGKTMAEMKEILLRIHRQSLERHTGELQNAFDSIPYMASGLQKGQQPSFKGETPEEEEEEELNEG